MILACIETNYDYQQKGRFQWQDAEDSVSENGRGSWRANFEEIDEGLRLEFREFLSSTTL